MNNTTDTKGVKGRSWWKALVVLVVIAGISVSIVLTLMSLGDGSASVRYFKSHWQVALGGSFALFVVVFGILFRAYKQLLLILTLALFLYILPLGVPESVPPPPPESLTIGHPNFEEIRAFGLIPLLGLGVLYVIFHRRYR